MSTCKNLYKDVMTGLFCITGILSFMSGQFVMSTVLFGAASLTSNLSFTNPDRA